MELVLWHQREPPLFADHDGVEHNLLSMPSDLLLALLEDAWHQRLAGEVRHRQDFADLRGLQWPPSRHETRLSALEHAQICSVREGAFLTRYAQGKYDLVRGSSCKFCQQVDTLSHRALVCSGYEVVRAAHPDAIALWPTVSTPMAQHLLPSRVAHTREVKIALMQLDDQLTQFDFLAAAGDEVHLFTDGSCNSLGPSGFALSAWAVVSATHSRVVSAGPVQGLLQTTNRAELTAALSALLWLDRCNASGVLWVDSAYVGRGITLILDTGTLPDFDTNEDLWMEIGRCVLELHDRSLRIQHISSHRDPRGQDDPLDEWTAKWNNAVDQAARQAQLQRPVEVQALLHAHWQSFLHQERNIDVLRNLHLALAKHAMEADPEMEDDEAPEADLGMRPRQQLEYEGGDWIDGIPLGWMQIWNQSVHNSPFALSVMHSLVSWLQTERDLATASFKVTWLQLAAMLAADDDFVYPQLSTEGGKNIWIEASSQSPAVFCHPTVAACIRFVKDAFRALDKLFDLHLPLVAGIDLAHYKVYPPQTGSVLFISAPTWRRAELKLQTLTAARPIRTVNDLARPFV